MPRKWLSVSTILAAIGAAGLIASPQATAADFYAGKTVRLVIGSGEGSGVDLIGRLVARHLGKHIPGEPNVIATNMPLPQSIAAANHVANVAEKDGLTIGSGSAGLFSRAISRPNIRFKLNELTWLGNMYSATVLFWMRTDFQCQTVEQMQKCPEPLKFGATARGSTGYGLVPELLKEAFGLKMDMIYGYKSSNIVLAVERGEVHASGGDTIGFFGGRPFEMMKEGKVKILMQVAGSKNPDLEPYNVPWVMDVVPASHRPLFQMVNPIIDNARPFYAPPGIPEDRAEILRVGFDKLAEDRDFADEARKAAKIRISYTPGRDMTTAIKEMTDQPEEVKAKVISLLQGGKKK